MDKACKNFGEWRQQNILDDEYFHRHDMYGYAHMAWKACKTSKNDNLLRKMLWLSHGCSILSLYADDGEMQCSSCTIDFKRDNPEHIFNKLQGIGQAKVLNSTIQQGG